MIRTVRAFAAGLALLLPCVAAAQVGGELTFTITRHQNVGPNTTGRILITCPDGYIPTGNSRTGAPNIKVLMVSEVGNSYNYTEFPTANYIGYEFTTSNREALTRFVTVTVTCAKRAMVVERNRRDIQIAGNGTAKADGLCDLGKVALGQVSNVDNETLLQLSRSFIFHTGGQYRFLEDMPDGETVPPVGIQLEVANATAVPQTIAVETQCADLPTARTHVSSTPTAPGQPFSLSGLFPDGSAVLGYSVVGGLYGRFSDFAYWGTDGSVSSQARFAAPSANLPATPVRNYFAEGVDLRPKFAPKATARAVMGVLVVPTATPAPPPTIVTVVEFYNAKLDHYFITAAAKEISDLDTGVHVGWARTGQSFKAYGPGSTGRPGRRPVCRDYGNPDSGLDSHFYSASPAECAATLASFNGAWLYEASEVFQLSLPDVVTGGCPLGSALVYRLWNQRADSNHRYVTTLALRDEMVSKGFVAEGYGPNAVTLCAIL